MLYYLDCILLSWLCRALHDGVWMLNIMLDATVVKINI